MDDSKEDALTAERGRGLYRKYDVRRVDRADTTGGKHVHCQYVVLDITHDRNALGAVAMYAATVRADGYGPLANDLERFVYEADRMSAEGLLTIALRAANVINKCAERLASQHRCEVRVDVLSTKTVAAVGEVPLVIVRALREVRP